ncbi:hypothetical protein HUJ04_006165 [Dendroctonus ponderosae]|nr:hypothetical protein HUJ04_006165 [Dendroctonus ponderosae]KAH1012214.1 hypothetical protein HUJ05_011408 [Dendroctonus ponderosae]
MANVLGGILWFLVLLTFAFPIAGFCAIWFILFYCFSQMCSACESCSDVLLKGMQLPGFCVNKIKNCEC